MGTGMRELILERPWLFTSERLPWVGRGRSIEEFLVRLHLSALYKNKRASQESLGALQDRKLKHLLRSATRVPFWENRIGAQLLRSNEPLSLIRALPVTTKDDLRRIPIEERTDGRLAAHYGVLSHTSGSTGEPLAFFVDRRLRTRFWALILRVGGLRDVSQKSLVHLWPSPNPNFSFDNHYYAKTMDDLREQKQEIYDLVSGPKSVVFGFPSLVRFVFDLARQDDVTLRPRTVILAGEALTTEARAWFLENSSSRVVNLYGCREISVMAGQCEQGRFHENSEDVLFEVVSEQGAPLKKGESGRLLVTALNNVLAPFIRYDTGDCGAFYSDPCPCGDRSPSFTFDGRTHDVSAIMLPDGSRISPYRLTGIFNRRFDKIRQYQIEHYAPSAFRIFIIPTERYTQEDEAGMLVDMKRIAKTDEVSVNRVDAISLCGLKALPYVKSFGE